ncbi:hypothetical protein M419DRAFT_80298 [Trichoderma reesei RUT C-30]|uniref:Uncharacterized protein n=1 Tax=Hypocrea jecorina (strain ATCC 56765 / BCRC 32924 / NRRL 11460 / Rut C-30) TaxID=1344414 RepID=A0A024SBP9_HYPJR|nr:hypothetical protein M419DRAFT_80298 [Trichoderma reesei RUT C-30]
MTRSCCPSFYGIVQIVARTAAWMTSVTTLVILAFIINQWPDKGGAIAAGLVGSAIAILNDSWIVVANIDRALGFQQLSPARALLHDLFSLAVSLGGIVMIIFSRYSDAADGFAALDSDSAPQVTAAAGQTDVISREGFSQVRMMAIAVWLLTAVV